MDPATSKITSLSNEDYVEILFVLSCDVMISENMLWAYIKPLNSKISQNYINDSGFNAQ
jgi:hypothetical protein